MKLFLVTLLAAAGAATAQEHPVPVTDSFRISGAVAAERTVTLSQVLKMPQHQLGDIMLRNKKGEAKGTLHGLAGVPLKAVLEAAQIQAPKHKNLSELCVILTASDGYSNVYSWNELYNTAVGDSVYIITRQDGKSAPDMAERILVMSLADRNSGSRHLKGLQQIVIKKVE